MLSFLNIIDLESGRQIRAAELGFYVAKPSFTENGIYFLRDGVPCIMDLDTGKLTDAPPTAFIKPADGTKFSVTEFNATESNIGKSDDTEVNGRENVKLRLLSPENDGIAYVELSFGERILARFMGSRDSVGECPISPDGKSLVFVGYPSKNGIN